MILAAADPNGPANMLATALFWTVGICVLAGIGKALDRYTTRRLRRHVSRALDHGDEHIRRAVTEHEDAYARRPQQHGPVPKRLTADRSHR